MRYDDQQCAAADRVPNDFYFCKSARKASTSWNHQPDFSRNAAMIVELDGGRRSNSTIAKTGALPMPANVECAADVIFAQDGKFILFRTG